MNEFVPELGQGLFGEPVEEYEVPEYAVALLHSIGHEIARVESNRLQEPVDLPVGWGGEYSTEVFTMRGFGFPEHDDEVPPPNFEATVPEVGHVVLRWYKHLGRGTSADRALTPDQWVRIFGAARGGDALVARAVDQGRDDVLEHHPVGDPATVTAPGMGRGELRPGLPAGPPVRPREDQ